MGQEQPGLGNGFSVGPHDDGSHADKGGPSEALRPDVRTADPEPLIAILSEDRLLECDGRLHGLNAFGSAQWRIYADIFKDPVIVARVERQALAGGDLPVEKERLRLWRIPSFQGPSGLLPRLPGVIRALRVAVREGDGFIVRWPGTLTLLALPFLLASRKPIAIEVVGDSRAIFKAGVGGFASRFLGWISQAAVRRLFAAASAVTYVTRSHLQGLYPGVPHAITSACSDVALAESDLRANPRPAAAITGRPARLLFAGTMEQKYKGLDTLLNAAAILKREGFELDLRLAGTGRLKAEIEAQIARLGLKDSAALLGRLERSELFDEMDACDLFVLPSRTEGLPRAIIEAMARAAPVIASGVGGIFELLPSDCLVEPDDPRALADSLAECLARPERLAAMSERNLDEARKFTTGQTEPIRRRFYSSFRSIVAAGRSSLSSAGSTAPGPVEARAARPENSLPSSSR